MSSCLEHRNDFFVPNTQVVTCIFQMKGYISITLGDNTYIMNYKISTLWSPVQMNDEFVALLTVVFYTASEQKVSNTKDLPENSPFSLRLLQKIII